MRMTAALAGLLVLVSGSVQPVQAYDAIADVTFAFGRVSGSMPAPDPGINANVAPGGVPFPGDQGWTSNGNNSLPQPTNDTYFSETGGYNSISVYNADFAGQSDYGAGTADDCLTPLPGYETIALRKYGCRHTDTVWSTSPYTPVFQYIPITDIGPQGGLASGTVTVTDTTLTGTLTIISSTDEPTGATTTITSGGTRTSASAGNGLDGYNYRTADGSPFGNAWYGVTTGATLTVNLTGTFTDTSWEINGGTVQFSDPGFACQQGGFGDIGDPLAGTLCTQSATGGGFQTDGGAQSWGMDLDGANTGFNTPSMIEVRDAAGTTTLATLSGVLASLTLDGAGNITTVSGEFRRGLGSSGGGCPDHVRWDSANTRISCGTITAGQLVITGAIQAGPDTEPDPFTFTDETTVLLGAPVTSAPVTITGINQPADISVSGDPSSEYSIGCTGTFTAAPGTINNNQTVCVRHTSAAAIGGTVDTILTVGTPAVSDTFTSTTEAPDTDPDPFSFTDQTNVALSTVVTSNTVTVSGINTEAPITVAGGEYSIGCTAGGFTTAAGTVTNGDTVCVRHTSAADFSTATDTTLTIGTVEDTFTSTTLAEDTTPDAFSFTDQVDVEPDTEIVSDEVTITGINSPADISVTGGEYSIGCNGTFTDVPGTISAGETVCVRHTSASGSEEQTDTTLTVGGVSDTFTSTTALEEVIKEIIDGGSSSLDLLILGLFAIAGVTRRRSR